MRKISELLQLIPSDDSKEKTFPSGVQNALNIRLSFQVSKSFFELEPLSITIIALSFSLTPAKMKNVTAWILAQLTAACLIVFNSDSLSSLLDKFQSCLSPYLLKAISSTMWGRQSWDRSLPTDSYQSHVTLK
jgi:hypothetical protein